MDTLKSLFQDWITANGGPEAIKDYPESGFPYPSVLPIWAKEAVDIEEIFNSLTDGEWEESGRGVEELEIHPTSSSKHGLGND